MSWCEKQNLDSTLMIPVRRLTTGPLHHFFGYYGICPWDRAGRYHLSLATDFHDRAPTPADTAAVGLVDSEDGSFQEYARTTAFNLQQGSMLHWLKTGHREEFTFNDREEERLVARAIDPASGRSRTFERAIAAIRPDGAEAIGLDFDRMYACRPVIGYANHRCQPPDIDPVPADDGLYRIDLETGDAELLLSVAEVVSWIPELAGGGG